MGISGCARVCTRISFRCSIKLGTAGQVFSQLTLLALLAPAHNVCSHTRPVATQPQQLCGALKTVVAMFLMQLCQYFLLQTGWKDQLQHLLTPLSAKYTFTYATPLPAPQTDPTDQSGPKPALKATSIPLVQVDAFVSKRTVPFPVLY